MATIPRFTFVQWTVCVIAAIGFAFDIYELLMLPLIVRPALFELVGAKPGTPEFEFWVGMLFFVPAMVGGVFGLLVATARHSEHCNTRRASCLRSHK